MDVIYTDSQWADIGVLDFDIFDMGFGSEENSFDVAVTLQENPDQPPLLQSSLVYIPGTEYGGIVDAVSTRVNNGAATATYKGRTWHGVLDKKVIAPATGQDYLTVSGEANTVLQQLINLLGLGDLFEAAAESSGLAVNYQFDRYTTGYLGIRKMLLSANAKLHIEKHSKVILSARPIVDYSNASYDDNNANFQGEQTFNRVNHLICLGIGQLSSRTVINLYADASGNVSQTQSALGIDDYQEVYDYSNADYDELLEKGTERLKEMQSTDSLDMALDEDEDLYDIDDIIEGRSTYIDAVAKASVIKKIVRIDSTGAMDVEYITGTTVGTLNTTGEFPLQQSGNKTYIATVAPTGQFNQGDSWFNPTTNLESIWEAD